MKQEVERCRRAPFPLRCGFRCRKYAAPATNAQKQETRVAQQRSACRMCVSTPTHARRTAVRASPHTALCLTAKWLGSSKALRQASPELTWP
ncbi:hypothetical protein NDU88_004156 [Pleurodeles waltl]|uniref:Uncharacterized protein n=1 Tax=Pleurodeles waltl TaxID=8319 RepID=A0AAV7VG90_PLEWA|nr:hypothetical protein NDU88_004156 [Pleurodeles waltl]